MIRHRVFFLRLLREGHALMSDYLSTDSSRLVYLSDHIFDFTTYDNDISKSMARDALTVCKAISDKTTFDLIKDESDYRMYITMVNMPFFQDKLDWGGSIRGAWWDDVEEIKTMGLAIGGEQKCELKFKHGEWEEFIAAVIEYGMGHE